MMLEETLVLIAGYLIGVLIGRYLLPNPRRRLATIEAAYSFPRNPSDNDQVWHLNRSKLYIYKSHLKEWLECEF